MYILIYVCIVVYIYMYCGKLRANSPRWRKAIHCPAEVKAELLVQMDGPCAQHGAENGVANWTNQHF